MIKRVETYADMVGMKDSTKPQNLSGGQKQGLQLLALAMKKYFNFDEATSMLDRRC